MHCANYLIINFSWHFDTIINKWINPTSGVDPGFQVRGEGACLIKLRRAEGGTKFFGVFRVKNHDFTPKNHIFSNCGGRREIVWGISCEKSRFYAKKIIFFPILAPPPLDPPLHLNCGRNLFCTHFTSSSSSSSSSYIGMCLKTLLTKCNIYSN